MHMQASVYNNRALEGCETVALLEVNEFQVLQPSHANAVACWIYHS